MRTLLVAGCIALSACTTQHAAGPAATQLSDTERPARAEWVRTELYLALGRLDGTGQPVAQAHWQRFLDEEVTPRFPGGFTVLNAYGQWLSRGTTQPDRLDSRLIVILYPADEHHARQIEEIRAAWKTLSNHVSVLRVSQPVAVSF